MPVVFYQCNTRLRLLYLLNTIILVIIINYLKRPIRRWDGDGASQCSEHGDAPGYLGMGYGPYPIPFLA